MGADLDVRLTAAAFDPQAEEAAFLAGRTDIGAVVSFTGRCRDRTDGRIVTSLFLDHYAGFSEREVARIVDAIAARCGCPDVKVIHRVGHVVPGDLIVQVIAVSPHRQAAFEAVRLLMDYLKTDAPLWKREVGPDGEYWIEPRPEDEARRAQAEALRIMPK